MVHPRDDCDGENESQVRGNRCSKASRPIRFATDTTGIGTCVYQRTSSIPGKFTTSTTESTLSISEVEFARLEGPFACVDSQKLDMAFKVETDVSPFTALGITA